jgi:Alpha/beta hydrolase domain
MKTEIRLQIDHHVVFASGHSFGKTGPYERFVGRVHFALDPEESANQGVVDLQYAPRNSRGLVEYSGDLDILKPMDLSRGNHRLLYDVNNRGNRTALRAFNDAPRVADPLSLEHAGNGFLMREGYTIVCSGWQGDLMSGNGLLVADLAEACQEGKPLQGIIRQEFISDQENVLCVPLSGANVIRSYEVIDPGSATLTRRERETELRQIVPSHEWTFAEVIPDSVPGSVKVIESNQHLYVRNGFRPGWIYELIYRSQGSRVMGLGIVGIRDLLSFLRYEDEDDASEPNPLRGAVDKVYGYGQSLTARVIRQFIYDGLNEDPLGRRVFDAVYVHVSGAGRLFANSRFAQVGRYPRQHEEHQWPSERYPFAYSVAPDSFTEKLDSVLKRPRSDPLVMHTHTSTEYWQRHASLGHTDPCSGKDLHVPENVRMYTVASAQHAGSTLAEANLGQQEPNLMANNPFQRAALVLMDRWATAGISPPPSRLPLRSDGTLVPAEDVLGRFPRIPGVKLPTAPSRLPLYDYGPEFDRGITTEHPPKTIPGKEYTLFVPQVDRDGNEIAGLRSPEIQAPVATHTGWNVRKLGFAEGQLYSLMGSFIPFARTKADRNGNRDPRLSIEERYGSHEEYIRAVATAARTLFEEGFLLQEDVARYIEAATKRNPLDHKVPLRPLIFNTNTPFAT